MKPKFKRLYVLCVAIAIAGFPIAIIEFLPGVGQWLFWALSSIFTNNDKSILEIARGGRIAYSWLAFHGLPSAVAFPAAAAIIWLCLQLTTVIEKRDYSARAQDGELTESELLSEIERRKEQAEYRKIGDKARAIRHLLGSAGTYQEEGLSIAESSGRTVIKACEQVGPEKSWREVFAAEFSPERTTSTERKYLRPDPGQSRLEIVTEVDSFTWPGRWRIEVFQPGKWEDRLDSLYTRAQELQAMAQNEAARHREAERKADLEKKRRRFGL